MQANLSSSLRGLALSRAALSQGALPLSATTANSIRRQVTCTLKSKVRAEPSGWRQLLSNPLNLSYCHAGSYDALHHTTTMLLQLCTMPVANLAAPAPPLVA
jgi:hypothetical protein